MSGREAGRESGASQTVVDPNTAEIAAGAKHEHLEGWVPTLASSAELHSALEQAFDYRGDVTITKKSGETIEGYIFDRRTGKSLADSSVRLLTKNAGAKISVSYADIAALAFTGRDMAAGKSWETWVRSYWERKAAGEQNISLEPENLE
ncbi:MAG TPA: hypothetical protein VF753_13145 [Terriglobales bacterium]